MTDEHADVVEPETPSSMPGDDSTPPAEKPSLKEGLREGAARAVGVAVELGSILSGESGTIVDAERDLAEERTEDFLDRIDGEG